jgi:LacI family transcriptional regulator
MVGATKLHHIARQAGVSVSTVSRVLNGVSGVSEGARRKVLAAAREMNYAPGVANHDPRASRLIAFLMPVEAEPWGVRTNFTEQGLSAINDTVTQLNYAAMLGSYNPTLGNKAEDEMIGRREFAGVLLFRTLDELRDSEPFRACNIPFLILNRLLPGTSMSYVGPDHLKVGLSATQHLLERGYRRIGLLSGSARYSSHRLYQQGFYDAHTAARLAVDPAMVTEVELNNEGGYEGTRRLMRLSPRPEALVVTGDRASLGCLKALSDLKLKIPRDIGVVTMDGTAETAFAHPPLTAVEIPWYDMLALGARLLIDIIKHRPPIEQIGVCYATRLVVRESTRPKTAAA